MSTLSVYLTRVFLPLFCLFAAVAYAQDSPPPPSPEPAQADSFVKLIEQLQNDPVARAAAREALQKRIEELKKAATDTQQVEKTRADLEASAKQAGELNARVTELTQQLEAARKELDGLEQRYKATQEQLNTSQQEQSDASGPLLVFERSLELLKALESVTPQATTSPTEPAPEPEPAPVPVQPAVDDASKVDFNAQILPILSNNCFACHGPDEPQRKAGLRLDDEAAAHKALSSGRTALVPGDRAKSELFHRVSTADADDKMPPASFDKTLTAEQIELLGKWIDEGAKYEKHWAFVPPVKPAAPEVKQADWPKNDIDRFVLARLEKEGLKPSPEADKETLIRRVTLDLTGLPPTPEEVDAFLQDAAPDAYEKVVDRLLASPRYGEQMARQWLDLSRYADTNGYHIDNERYMWRWRDWVINAFNQNMPFDRFTIEQLAGDLLPSPTLDQRIATGFNRNHMITFEGGIIPEEYRVQYVIDRVNTTSTVWMGLTANCAQCHDHKFDPISQKEYFQMFAFYNTVPEQGSDGNTGNANPLMKAPLPEQEQELAKLDAEVQALLEKMNQPLPEIDAAQAAWEAEQGPALQARWLPLDPVEMKSTGGATLTERDDRSVLVSGTNADKDTYEIVAQTDVTGITAFRLEAIPDASLPHGGTARSDVGNFVLTELEAEISPVSGEGEPIKVTFAAVAADFSQEKFDIGGAVDGKPETGWAISGFERREKRVAVFVSTRALGFPGGTKVVVRLKHDSTFAKHNIGCFRLSIAADPSMAPAELGSWYVSGPFKAESGEKGYETEYEPEKGVDLNAAYDDGRMKWLPAPEFADAQENALKGDVVVNYLYRTIKVPGTRKVTLSLGSNDSMRVWLNEAVVHESPKARPLKADEDRVDLQLQPGENRLLMKVVNYGGKHAFFFRVAQQEFGDVPVDVEAVLAKATDSRTPDEAQRLKQFFRSGHWPEWKPLEAQMATLKQQRNELDAKIPTVMVMAELEQPRETFLLKRGMYDQPGDKVTPAVPAILPQLAEGQPPNRLGLAQWLVSPSHPLTSRVVMNRMWGRLFGTGIVKTLEDFGIQGERPVNPKLLDWLATEFVAKGWDMKAMNRLMVTSAAYRQSSRSTPELNARDPENRLLARGPRFRMDAEMIRDGALAASGLLVGTIGGPSVKPYQPAGLWEEVSFGDKNFTAQAFEQDHGEALYRRSMYTFWKRTAPPPSMVVFDAPNREVCTVRRARTNTPLQALALLNDPQYVEAARRMAERMMKEGGATPEERVAYGFRLMTARKPKPEETAVLVETFQQQLEAYRPDPETAKKLLTVGESPRDETLDPCEHAAWTTVASMILNLDETVTKS